MDDYENFVAREIIRNLQIIHKILFLIAFLTLPISLWFLFHHWWKWL